MRAPETADEASVDNDRRTLFVTLSSLTALAVSACASSGAGEAHAPEKEKEGEGAEVTPGEDLMQEHGVLDRVLLIYDEVASRLESGKQVDMALVKRAGDIVRRFVEDYHEKQEEDFVFPRLVSAGKQVELVATLKDQHAKGRQLTDAILAATAPGGAADPAKLAGQLRSFTRMYRPHMSREETILFPAFRSTLDQDGYHELGEKFEDREHALFGEGGFEKVVADVGEIEAALGLSDLASFTPT